MKNLSSLAVSVGVVVLIAGAIPAVAAKEKKKDVNIDACFNYRQGQDYEKAIASGKKAIVSSPKSFDSHFCLGSAYDWIGESKLALPELKKAETLAITKEQLQRTATYLGHVYRAIGNIDEALKQHNKNLKLSRELDDMEGVASAFNNIASIYSDELDQKEKAVEYYREAVNANIDELKKSTYYCNYAMALSELERHDEANAAIQKAIITSEQAGDYHLQAVNIIQSGYIQYREGNNKKAETTLLQGLKKIREVGDLHQEGEALQKLGWVYAALGEKSLAIDSLKNAQTIFARIGAQASVKKVQVTLDRLNN